jgi:hypothetical protein
VGDKGCRYLYSIIVGITFSHIVAGSNVGNGQMMEHLLRINVGDPHSLHSDSQFVVADHGVQLYYCGINRAFA